MTITSAANACEAVGWPGALGFSAFCLLILGGFAVLAWHDVSTKGINKP